MSLLILMIVMGALALVLAILAMRLLFRSGWFLGWLKGSLGISMLLATGVLCLTIYVLKDYNVQAADASLGNVSLTGASGQQYVLKLSEGDHAPVPYTIEGDFWTVSYRILDFSVLPGTGKLPITYQVEGVSARFMTLEQELKAKNIPVIVNAMGQKIWPLMVLLDRMGVIRARVAELEFVPVIDGALFDVHFKDDQIELVPLNEPGKAALQR